jgi:hypothetical protein
MDLSMGPSLFLIHELLHGGSVLYSNELVHGEIHGDDVMVFQGSGWLSSILARCPPTFGGTLSYPDDRALTTLEARPWRPRPPSPCRRRAKLGTGGGGGGARAPPLAAGSTPTTESIGPGFSSPMLQMYVSGVSKVYCCYFL